MAAWALCASILAPVAARADPALAEPLADLGASLPQTTSDLSEAQTGRVIAAAAAVDRWAGELAWERPEPDRILEVVEQLVDAKSRVDGWLDQTLALRTRFVDMPEGIARREMLCRFLRVTAQLIDLSGRLRYRLRALLEGAVGALNADPRAFRQLVRLLIQRRVSIGAVVLSAALFDPAPESGRPGYAPEDKYRVLKLITETRQSDLVPVLAAFVRQEPDPALVVIGVAALRIIGVPQKPRPGSGDALPEPAIAAEELRDILHRIDPARLSKSLAEYREKLLAWLAERIRWGVVGESYRWGHLDVRPGDWLLMRNPSPYNLFSDLSPGLFTHVGVVAAERGEDGIRRFVIVDLPERGAHIPAANVDAYLTQTLHYAFLRHEDSDVARRMGQAALDMIGNECQFDLTFQTRRVEALRGKPLKGQRIHTYCAGFLLVCAGQTGLGREEFFPIPERAAGGKTLANLRRLGLSIGDDFISPTGALFSPHLEIVGRREPMYDPGRGVQEAIYDHFADSMAHKTLTPSPDAYQLLREKLAGLANRLPWLARAMARAHDVSEHMDLEAAARAAAVVETLDEIAERNLNAFAEARAAILAGPMNEEARKQYTQDALNLIEAYRRRHAELWQRWRAGQVSQHAVREALVRFYAQRGRSELDERFFQPGEGGRRRFDRSPPMR